LHRKVVHTNGMDSGKHNGKQRKTGK